MKNKAFISVLAFSGLALLSGIASAECTKAFNVEDRLMYEYDSKSVFGTPSAGEKIENGNSLLHLVGVLEDRIISKDDDFMNKIDIKSDKLEKGYELMTTTNSIDCGFYYSLYNRETGDRIPLKPSLVEVK